MKNIQKYAFIVLVSVVLVCISIYAVSLERVIILPIHFQMHNPYTEKMEDNHAFVDKDGNSFVFLPSYVSMDQITIVLHGNRQYFLGDTVLYDGMTCSNFELEKPYDVIVNNRRVTTLWFYRSENVATMYINTDSGTMDYIHEDKNHEEKAALTVYTVDGEINYYNPSITMKGRGNFTWNFDKHPYALMLPADGDLLDMGAATNWVLLSNTADRTNISNYLCYNMAADCGLAWTPECRYVDVYLNGEYNGLYLLTEKVEGGVNRVNIDTSTGDFLGKFELAERCRNHFRTNAGRDVDIIDPRTPQQTEYETIRSRVNQLEQVIHSGTDLSTSELIDLDSWVRRYLIDEISANIDSDLASSYFYYSNGVFYAGPVWDYDMTFGNSSRNHMPNSFIAKNADNGSGLRSPFYGALYENESFYNRMVEIYKLEFLPVLQRLLDGELQDLINDISKATQMNRIRWESMYDSAQIWHPYIIRETEDWVTYLEKRVAFLNDAWVNNTEYCTVQFEFEPNDTYWNISVPKGCLLKTSYQDVTSKMWIDASTGEICDLGQPIMRDMILILTDSPVKVENIHNSMNALEQQSAQSTAKGEDAYNSMDALEQQSAQFASKGENAPNSMNALEQRSAQPTSYYVVLLSVVMLFILFLALVIIDVTYRRKENSR